MNTALSTTQGWQCSSTLHRVTTLDDDRLFDQLSRVARNYAWTWDAALQAVLDRAVGSDWAGFGHPLMALRALGPDQRHELAHDPAFVEDLASAVDIVEELEQAAPESPHTGYISAEFGISETLPQYSGGLGILAGDHLKAASDLGLSLVAVGLFYSHGYFTQEIDAAGQQARYDTFYPADHGLTDTGQIVSVDTPEGTIHAAVWVARVGSVELYLLDARVAHNAPWAAAVTDRLYGGDQHKRIHQEMLLGIGGLRALRAVGREPATIHLNEGHAGFGLLELLGEELDTGKTIAQARQAVRQRCLFTTHTPVPAGIDQFPRSLIEPYLSRWADTHNLTLDDAWAMGQLGATDEPTFNMAALCLSNSGLANGVSSLHGEVSRELFGAHPAGSAITSVTNGVHARTWTDPAVQALFDSYLESSWPHGDDPVWAKIDTVPSAEIRGVRNELRTRLVSTFNRDYGLALDPAILTVGFARRFATYKRAALLLLHLDRLEALLQETESPIQFIFAGKAHPNDTPGQSVLSTINAFSRSAAARGRFVIVPGYDMSVASEMYAGCDVWLNTPVRPQEACGTSGEKAALNGGINCSIADGWWAEWCHPENGWVIPSSDLADPDERDQAESAAIYHLLETEVIPQFYGPASQPVSDVWIERIRFGWSYLGPKVTAGRMVAEYRDRLYSRLGQTNAAYLDDVMAAESNGDHSDLMLEDNSADTSGDTELE